MLKKSSDKIFHGPINISGKAYDFAEGQRHLGYYSHAFCMDTGRYEYEVDEVFDDLNYEKYIEHYDIFNFYYGFTLGEYDYLELETLQSKGKRLFFHFVGCDIRNSKETIRKYRYSACKGCWPMACAPLRQLNAIKIAREYGKGIFVSTPDLLEFVPEAIWLPQPINLGKLSKKTAQFNAKKSTIPRAIKILHSPSSMQIKGTQFIIETIDKLTREGYNIDLVVCKNKSNEEVLNSILSTDIVIDQLYVGAYGKYSVEAMALGKPVICYLRDDLKKHYHSDLPIISATIDNIYHTLKDLINNRESWEEIGAKGKRYTEKFHCHLKLSRQLLSYY